VRRAGEGTAHRLKAPAAEDDGGLVTDLVSSAAADLLDLSLEQLRARRAALVEQSSRAARWRRLVQARLDLAVDAAVPVEELDELDAPCPPLRALVHGRDGVGPVAQLAAAAVARRDLGTYCAGLDDELGRATEELVERYRDDPARCLVPVPVR